MGYPEGLSICSLKCHEFGLPACAWPPRLPNLCASMMRAQVGSMGLPSRLQIYSRRWWPPSALSVARAMLESFRQLLGQRATRCSPPTRSASVSTNATWSSARTSETCSVTLNADTRGQDDSVQAQVFVCREQKCPCGQWQINWRKQLPKHIQKDKYEAVQTILQEVSTSPCSAAAVGKSSTNGHVLLDREGAALPPNR